MPYMTRQLEDVKRYFPRVDTVPGWEKRGSESFAPAGVVCHWTAGPRGTTKRASLTVVTHGRENLEGPLCNWYLDRDGVPVLVAAGRANHAGRGGWKGLVGNSAVYGIEAESAGENDWTPAQRLAYPRLVRALLEGLGRGPEWACGHNEWAPGRKIDIRDWPMPVMRNQVGASAPGYTEEDEMTPAEKQQLTDVHRVIGLIYDVVTPGVEGKKEHGSLFREVAHARDAAETAPRRTWEWELAGAPAWVSLVRQGDAAGLAEQLKPAIAAALASAKGSSADEVATKVADALSKRLAS